jgi:hypothetical protein
MAPLLNEGWKLAGEWASTWFAGHPDPSAKDLETLFVDFTPPLAYPGVYDPNQGEFYGMEGSAAKIGEDVYVVRTVYENNTAVATSTFFVVVRGADGQFRQQWSIKPLAEQHYRLKDEIGLWAFLGSCAYYCGPLVVHKLVALPPAENGHLRFAIDAFQATNGNTLMKKLSVWEWNGTQAKNLIIGSYQLYIDEDREIQLVGNLLTIPTKEATRSFSSYGCCAGPRGIWMIRVTPVGTQDLGHRLLQPQIEWADLLAASRTKSPSLTGLAAPSDRAVLKDVDGSTIDQCRVLSHGQKRPFEISFGEGTKLWLAYKRLVEMASRIISKFFLSGSIGPAQVV